MRRLYLCIAFLVSSVTLLGQSGIPEKPKPPKLVNNLSVEFPNFISTQEAIELENELQQFSDSTSNQLSILIVDDLNGYEPWEFASKVIDLWGIGQAKEDNGILLLIKPTGGKNERKVFIATGRGLEGAIPDATCKAIVENELLPAFRNQDYYKGIRLAVNTLKSLAKGEYNSDAYAKKHKKEELPGALIVLLVIAIIVFLLFRNRGGGFTMGGGGIFFGGGFGGNHRGSNGGFGGFGGFGGGSSGGGGAGGDW
jgi:uncharacterized protein